MTGIPELKYNDVLCGALYRKYFPKFPEQVVNSLPSQIKPKLAFNLLGNSSGLNTPPYSILSGKFTGVVLRPKLVTYASNHI